MLSRLVERDVLVCVCILLISPSHCTVNPVVSVFVLSLLCLYVGADGGTVDGLIMTLSTRGLQICAFGDECYFMPRCFVFRECCMMF